MKTGFRLRVICLAALAVISGCRKNDVPAPPKTQPELLLEIYDTARKQEYNAALLKLQKMRAMDPTSVVLPELENVIHFNRLSAVVNTYLRMGKFEEALNAIQQYESRYGYSESTTKTKERLFLVARMDRQIRSIKQSRRAEQLENEIRELKKLTKNIKLSRKIANFIKNKESMLPELRKFELELTLRELEEESKERFLEGERKTGEVLMLIYALTDPGQSKQFAAVSTGPDNRSDIKNGKQLLIERKKP